MCTCTVHSGAKKAHDWAVDQLADLFRTTHQVKTQQVVKSLGQHCGDIELAGYLVNLRVTLNLDGAPIASNSHTHPSHSQTSRLLTLSLSLGVAALRPTQCIRDT